MKQSNKTKLNMENKADKRLSSFKMPDLNLIPHWLKMGDPKIHEDLGRVLTLVDIPKVGNVQEMNDLYKHRGSKTTFFSSVSSISNGNIANNGINNANKEINKPEQSVKLNMDYSIMAQSAVYDDNVSKSVKSVPVNKSALSSKFVHNHNGKQSNNSSPITSVDIPSSSTSKGCVEQPNLNRLKISTTEAILVCQAIKIEDRVSRNKSATRIFRPVRQMISQDDATYVCQAIKIPDSSVNNFPSVSTSQNDVQKKDFHQDQIITNTMTVSATASIDSKCVSSQAIQPRTCHDSITTRRKGRKLQPPKRLILGLVGPAEPSLYERRMMSATKLTKSMYESYLGRPVDNDDDDDEERFFLGLYLDNLLLEHKMYISSEFENEDPDNTDGDLQTETTDEPTKKKRAKRSAIHTHFDIEDEKWMCKSCGSKFTVNLQTTSTPLRHLRDKHPNLCTSNEDLSSLVVLAEDFSTEIFQNKLVDTVISECLPFSIVESPWLKDIFNYCHPAAILPQRRKLKSEIFKKYENEKSNLMETLTNIPGKISCILDNWTSSNMHPYQGIIVQYVSENWEIVSIVLDLTLLEGSHSGVNMANALITVLEEYNILDKLIAITTDNATNNNTMVRELSTKMNEKGFHFDCENNRVRCFAHIVNLACTAAFEEIKCVTSLQAEDSENVEISLISKLRNGVKAIRVSTLKREAFRDQCKSQKTKHNELIIDVKTRWNSTYYMIKRSLKLKVPFTTTLKADTECSKYALTDEEFEILEKVRLLLKPFKTATKDISNTPFPTISLCSLLYNQIFKHLELYFPNISNEYNPIDELTNEAPPEWLQKAAKTAWDKMDTYYPTSDGLVYIIGSIMDPRCKLTWFNDNFPADDVNNYKKTIVSYWTSHYKPTVEDVNTQFSPERSKNAWVRHVYSKEKTKKKSDELEIYLREKTSLNPDKSALDWWKLHEDEYPNLSKMARDFLHISGSGVPVECLFSNGPDLLRNRRQSLNDESITKCICLKLWLAKGGENTAGKAAAEKMGGI